MENSNITTKEYYTVDFGHILKSLRKRIWMIIASGLVAAIAALFISAIVITPTYSSSILLYVNNNSTSATNPGFSISSSQLTAAQSLIKTYGEILNNRTTLQMVIDETDVSYTHKQLSNMISTEAANNTEVMRVTVVATDPVEASVIANGIAEILPNRIAAIIDGATVELVESAIPNYDKVGPNVTMYTAIGLILGAIASALVVALFALMDSTVHGEEYVLQNYNYPILAKVPNLLSVEGKHYGYYKKKTTSERVVEKK